MGGAGDSNTAYTYEVGDDRFRVGRGVGATVSHSHIHMIDDRHELFLFFLAPGHYMAELTWSNCASSPLWRERDRGFSCGGRGDKRLGTSVLLNKQTLYYSRPDDETSSEREEK